MPPVTVPPLDPWYLEHLVCPVDRAPLRYEGGRLVSERGREYGICDGVPVMLVPEVQRTHWVFTYSLYAADNVHCPIHQVRLEKHPDRLICHEGHEYKIDNGRPLELIPEMPRSPWAFGYEDELREFETSTDPARVDPFVKRVIHASGGRLWAKRVGNLHGYPIPEIPLSAGEGRKFLELGCNWGRWCVAAARRGYDVVGIDPSIQGIQAAQRVTRQLGVKARFLVADSRYLPFADDSFDVVFSYSVLQSMAKENVGETMQGVRRILTPGGYSKIQMANAWGPLQLFNRWRYRHRPDDPTAFLARWWTVAELQEQFGAWVGPSEVSIDGFLSLNPQAAEAHLLPWHYRPIVYASDALRAVSRVVPPLKYVADSVYVTSTKRR
ncbi:MAG: methyltransferase domain-containing protein [Pirellulales bacterium]|nr:methyltransferase domain-containing protein [Pirellulales bacterium]